MNNKIIVLVISSIAILLVVAFLNTSSLPDKIETEHNLEKYRLGNIPEDCKMPEYENSPSKWRDHLSHHKETEFCLKYYEDLTS